MELNNPLTNSGRRGFPILSIFQNGVISYELDKMEIAQTMLRDLEHRCTSNSTWLQSIRSMIFRGGSTKTGQNPPPPPHHSRIERLENQIVLADVQLCSAILTLLTQDISGMMRGSWLLKRAWKIYQSVYQEIYQLYRDSVDADVLHNLPHLKPATTTTTSLRHSSSNTTVSSTCTNSDWSITSNESTPPVLAAPRKGIVQSFSEYFLSSPSAAGDANDAATKKAKKWRRKSKKKEMPRSKSSPEDMRLNQESEDAIDPQVVQRLMGAVSFGYGAFQLAVSLLPPSMLKLVSFFGFEGDREMGLACLQFSRSTQDMRAPLSTIALLWYLTVGHQIFTAESGGEAAHEKNIAQVTAILSQCATEFAESALFGFFRGRLSRMHKDMPGAIEHFERAYYTSVLPELRLLCLHEMGWCRLIQLDCLNAIDEFHALRVNSEYSKSFFGYLTALCHGVVGKGETLLEMRADIVSAIGGTASAHRDQSQIDRFIEQRVALFPDTAAGMQAVDPVFWRFLVYELLFLWNTLDTCPCSTLDQMAADCQRAPSAEPIPGLSLLILATCEKLRGNGEESMRAYRECLEFRRPLDDEPNAKFTHISAFANYKLAMLLLSDGDRAIESQQLLQTAQSKYKNYDFESRLSLRIHTAIKELSAAAGGGK